MFFNDPTLYAIACKRARNDCMARNAHHVIYDGDLCDNCEPVAAVIFQSLRNQYTNEENERDQNPQGTNP